MQRPRFPTRFGRRALAVAALCAIVAAIGCAKPPDPDGEPLGSRPLTLGTWQRDGLDCDSRGGDCADWYHFETPTTGTLRIDVAKLQDDAATPDFSVLVGESSGRQIVEERNGGRTRLLLKHPAKKGRYAEAGRYTLAIRTSQEKATRFEYELRVEVVAKPVARKAVPRFRKVRASLLELETLSDGRDAVLLDKGRSAGLARGQRGRLLQGGKKVADIEVVDVYADGCRAAIRGSSSGVTASTVAEVDVPL